MKVLVGVCDSKAQVAVVCMMKKTYRLTKTYSSVYISPNTFIIWQQCNVHFVFVTVITYILYIATQILDVYPNVFSLYCSG